MVLHLVSLESADPINDYYTIRKELSEYDTSLADKEEWIILTKKDLVKQQDIDSTLQALAKTEKRVLVVSHDDSESYKQLSDLLVAHLRPLVQ